MTRWKRGRGWGQTVETAGGIKAKEVGGVGWEARSGKLSFPFGPDWKARKAAGGTSSSHPGWADAQLVFSSGIPYGE